jgi:hypothetical protein
MQQPEAPLWQYLLAAAVVIAVLFASVVAAIVATIRDERRELLRLWLPEQRSPSPPAEILGQWWM